MALLYDSSSKPERPAGQRLDSWKAIAAHLGRDVRTVQRWEKESALPVHRLKHESRSRVFAWTGELDQWVAARSESPEAARRRFPYWPAAAIALVVLAVGVALMPRTPQPPAQLAVRPLTSEIGLFWSARLSPDARRLVYLRRVGHGSADLILRELADGKEQPLAATEANEYSPAWSPDGSSVAFLREIPGGMSEIMTVSPGNLTERRIARLAAPPFGSTHLIPPHLDWAPDGGSLLVAARDGREGRYRLALVDVKSGSNRWLTDPPSDDHGDTNGRFSPDGKRIVVTRADGGGGRFALLVYDFDPRRGLIGKPRRISAAGDVSVQDAAWTPDGRSILFTAGRDLRLWLASADGGPSRPLPYSNPLVRMPDVRTTADGRWLMTFVQSNHDVDLVRIPLLRDGGAPLAAPPKEWLTIADSTSVDGRPTLSPDGSRLAFTSHRTGSPQIWIADLATGRPHQLTRLPPTNVGHIAWSPDGRQISFVTTLRSGRDRDIYTVRVDDGSVAPLVERASDDRSQWWSADGKTLFFVGGTELQTQIWQLPATGAPPSVAYDRSFSAFRDRPDGGHVLVNRSFWTLRSVKDEPELLTGVSPYDPNSFDVVPRGVYFVAGKQRLLYVDFATRKLSTVAELPRPPRAGIAVSRDERFAYVSLAEERLSIVMADDLRPSIRR